MRDFVLAILSAATIQATVFFVVMGTRTESETLNFLQAFSLMLVGSAWGFWLGFMLRGRMR